MDRFDYPVLVVERIFYEWRVRAEVVPACSIERERASERRTKRERRVPKVKGLTEVVDQPIE